jgi:hypothetical protein
MLAHVSISRWISGMSNAPIDPKPNCDGVKLTGARLNCFLVQFCHFNLTAISFAWESIRSIGGSIFESLGEVGEIFAGLCFPSLSQQISDEFLDSGIRERFQLCGR